MPITGSMLYDMTVCEHRVFQDLFGDPDLRDPVDPFVELLWKQGNEFEDRAISEGPLEALNLRVEPREAREALTREAMDRGERLIYGGRLSAEDLLGEPDLLRLEDSGYVPIDIKWGSAFDGSSGKPKPHYAAQLGLYVDILERLGRSPGRYAIVYDKNGDEVRYDFEAPKGPKTQTTLWDDYVGLADSAREIVEGRAHTTPAAASHCRSCHWKSVCHERLVQDDDLTLIADLSRNRRELLLPYATTVADLAALDQSRFLDEKGKSTIKGMGVDMLSRFIRRAQLIKAGGQPVLKQPVALPNADVEVVLDIEDDSFRDHCYLHGLLIRQNGQDAQYVSYFSHLPDQDNEREAFSRAWELLSGYKGAAVYVYSSHERTWWRKLQIRYPDVCSEQDLADLFDGSNFVDLYYGVIQPATEWPTSDYGLKSIASYLGFSWRDEDPSATSSMVWYARYLDGDEGAKRRILTYNEDDCRATLVVLDAIRSLAAQS